MKMTFLALGLAAVTLLTACETSVTPRPPQMTFENYDSIQLNAAQIEVIDAYRPPMRDPNVEHRFPYPPYAAAASLLQKKLVAAGSENILRVLINDASVVREELTVDTGISDVFKREPAERLKAKVLVRFELVSAAAPDIVLGHAEVIARRTKTLMEDTSVADREQAYFSLTEDLMDDLNDGLRTVVRNTFGKH